ncbi:MAG: thioredoxin domain-containing protein [Pseudomonadota bacterium]
MNQDSVIVSCTRCGSKNRVPKARLKEHPVCGKCKAALTPESVIINCLECGAKNRVFKALLNQQAKCGKCHVTLKPIQFPAEPVQVTDHTFKEEVLSFPGPVLLEYYSNSCGYCKMLDPILNQLASQYSGRLKIAKLNVEQNPLAASQYDIMSTPTMILFKGGKQVDKLLGAMSKEEIEEHLRVFLS